MQASLEQHITDNLPNPTVGDVIGGRRTIIKDYPTLPASMQLKVLLKASDFTEMQDIMRPKYRLAFDKDILGNIVNPLELNFAKLNNHKLTLSFKPATATDEQALAALIPENAQGIEDLPTSIPAHLIRVIPQVALDEVVVKSGSPMFLGYDLTLYYQVQFSIGGTMNKEYRIPAGSYVNLMFGAGSVSDNTLSKLQSNMENTKNILESQNQGLISALTEENILGNIFKSGSLSYIAQYDAYNYLLGKKLSSKFNLSPVLGTYGYEPNVNYFFGLPTSISQGGIGLNIYTTRQITNNENSQIALKLYNQSIGMITSSLEHAVPEQQFASSGNAGEGISSVKALRVAILGGQKIYQITQDNRTTIQNLNLHPESIQEISNAVDAGYTVITHTDSINLNGWIGEGYIILNPITGDGAFKITGGSNGGIFLLVLFIILAIMIVIAVGGIGAVLTSGIAFGELANWIAWTLTGVGFVPGLSDLVNSLNDISSNCGPVSTAIGGLGMVAAFLLTLSFPLGGLGIDLFSIIFSIFGFAGAIPTTPAPNPHFCRG